MLSIVQLEGESLIAEVRRPAFAHDWVEHAKTSPAQVIERLAGASIAVAMPNSSAKTYTCQSCA